MRPPHPNAKGRCVPCAWAVDCMNCIIPFHTVALRIPFSPPNVNGFLVTNRLHTPHLDALWMVPHPNHTGTLFRIFTAFSTISLVFLPFRWFSELFLWIALTSFVTSCILFCNCYGNTSVIFPRLPLMAPPTVEKGTTLIMHPIKRTLALMLTLSLSVSCAGSGGTGFLCVLGQHAGGSGYACRGGLLRAC